MIIICYTAKFIDYTLPMSNDQRTCNCCVAAINTVFTSYVALMEYFQTYSKKSTFYYNLVVKIRETCFIISNPRNRLILTEIEPRNHWHQFNESFERFIAKKNSFTFNSFVFLCKQFRVAIISILVSLDCVRDAMKILKLTICKIGKRRIAQGATIVVQLRFSIYQNTFYSVYCS